MNALTSRSTAHVASSTSAHVLTEAARPSSGIAGPRFTDRSQVATALAIGLSLYALYWVLFIVQPQIYRVSFLLVALVLTFLLFPARRASSTRPRHAARLGARSRAPIVALSWPIVDFSRVHLPRRRSAADRRRARRR